jgi:hypothetical protein
MKPSINTFLCIVLIVAPISWLLGHYLGFWGAVFAMPFGLLVGYFIPRIVESSQ